MTLHHLVADQGSRRFLRDPVNAAGPQQVSVQGRVVCPGGLRDGTRGCGALRPHQRVPDPKPRHCTPFTTSSEHAAKTTLTHGDSCVPWSRPNCAHERTEGRPRAGVGRGARGPPTVSLSPPCHTPPAQGQPHSHRDPTKALLAGNRLPGPAHTLASQHPAPPPRQDGEHQVQDSWALSRRGDLHRDQCQWTTLSQSKRHY